MTEAQLHSCYTRPQKSKEPSSLHLSSPINALPAEILSYIMLLLKTELKWGRSSYPVNCSYPRQWLILSLSRVCKKWRTIVLTTATLWTEIEMDNPKMIPIFLERSREAPIQIRHLTPPPKLHVDQVTQLWTPVLSSSYRISYLCIRDMIIHRSFCYIKGVMDLLKDQQLSWPQLAKLELNTTHYKFSDGPLVLHPSIRLKRLKLAGVLVSFESPTFGPCLLSLCLDRVKIEISDFREALRQCTRLENLVLRARLKSSANSLNQPDATMINSLRQLEVGMNDRDLHIFLDHVHIPGTALANLRIACNSTPNHLNELFPPDNRILTRLRQNSVQTFEISFRHASVNHVASLTQNKPTHEMNKDIILQLTIKNPNRRSPTQHLLVLLTHSLGSPDCRDLSIFSIPQEIWRLDALGWQSVLASFPNLEILGIGDYTCELNMLNQCLVALTLAHESGPILPRLQVIVLKFAYPMKRLGKVWGAIEGSLRKLCEQGRKLGELRVTALDDAKTPFPIRFTDDDRELLETSLGPYVGKLTLDLCFSQDDLWFEAMYNEE